ncbi:MAG: hypothetical protein IJU56_08625 [Clostridia bacterium]|nr:hypothetical protein [Clostridia bacterium]
MFRHFAQKSLTNRQVCCAISVTSDEKFPRQSSRTELISGYLTQNSAQNCAL